MSEEPPSFPEPVPTNHGRFEGPATKGDYEVYEQREDLALKDAAQLRFQEREATRVLAEKEADIYDDVTKLLKREVFKREADYRLSKLSRENRYTQPNNAIVANFDGKGLKEWNDTKGHDEGDRKLFNIGQIIASAGREDDLIGRAGDGSDEFGAVYFFRDNIISAEDMAKKLNERIIYLVKFAVSRGDIAGLKWKLVPYEQGKDINELLRLADPIPGSEGLMEWPPAGVLPSRK